MHNLQLTEDQDLIVDTVRKFVADVVGPTAQELDEHRTFVREQFDGLAELGVFGLCVAEANGGAGMGMLPYVAALEAVGAHGGSLARLWIEQARCAAALEVAGAELLADVAAGSVLATFVGPEHGLVLQGGTVSGTARVVPAGAHAQKLVVAALDGQAPVLAVVDAGAVKHKALPVIGLASAGCAALQLEHAEATVVATGDTAMRAIAAANLNAWIGVAAAAIGGGHGAIAAARKHAAERIAFGKPLLVQEAVQRKLVETRRAVDAARHLTWHAARLADLGTPSLETAIMARLAAVDAAIVAADEAIQIHGGFGYTVEYHVERHYRDATTLEVLDGGGETLRNRLASLQFA